MSLFAFPPLNTEGKPYAIQEFNGRIITGNENEFLAVNKSHIIADLPSIDRTQLKGLQHSISKENMMGFAASRQTSLGAAWNQLSSTGLGGVMQKATDAAEPTKLWPLARLGRGVLRMHNGVASIAARVLPSNGQEKAEELLQKYSTGLDWKKGWIRCIAVHPNGGRLAVCQPNDYIRIFAIGPGQNKTPLTLKHPKQENVSCMQWEPFDQRVLAVAAGQNILIWRLTTKTAHMKPSAQCARVIETSLCPLNQLVWDRVATRLLLASSPDSSKILSVDTMREEVECIGSWSWSGGIARMVPSEDGGRLAVLYTSNVIKIFDRSTWESEKRGNLKGRPVDAVWSPSGDALLFVTEDSYQIQAITFVQHTKTTTDGLVDTKWVGESAKQVFDLTPVEFDSAEAEIQGAVERPLIEIGGRVQRLALSPDGRRLAISFKEFTAVVATFIVDWHPFPRLTPSGFVEAPNYGEATMISFMPKFNEGSLLCIVWSEGHVQYLPFIYAPNASMLIQTRNILDEISGTTSALGNNSTRGGISKRPPSVSDSLRSSELPSGVCDRSEGNQEEEVLMTERIRRNHS